MFCHLSSSAQDFVSCTYSPQGQHFLQKLPLMQLHVLGRWATLAGTANLETDLGWTRTLTLARHPFRQERHYHHDQHH